MRHKGKLVMLGDASVGKSSLVQRATTGEFDSNQLATVSAAYVEKQLTVVDSHKNDVSYLMHVWDTSGQERFAQMASVYYRGADVAIIAFDVSNKKTFEKAQHWITEVKQKSMNPRLLIALAANKCDLLADQWQVQKEEAKHYADEEGIQLFFVSAKTGECVEEMFQKLTQASYTRSLMGESKVKGFKLDATETKKQGCC